MITPKIITLCGSTRFMKEFREVERFLTLEGCIPLPPAIFGKSEGLEYTEELAKHLWELHLEKIELSDGIFIVNPNGYLGDSTNKEIEFAKQHSKSIRYYSEEFEEINKSNDSLESLKQKPNLFKP